ncbi:MAG: acylphosphatase [Mogibacterium sp.]|nr:acylphosphatase [Mogibacterium sp.]
MDTENKLRQHIVFHGWVQGVGFRFRAMQAARTYGVTGWVRNDPDGSVTMEVQGSQQQIDNVIMALEHGSFISIDRMEVTAVPPAEGERGFIPVL